MAAKWQPFRLGLNVWMKEAPGHRNCNPIHAICSHFFQTNCWDPFLVLSIKDIFVVLKIIHVRFVSRDADLAATKKSEIRKQANRARPVTTLVLWSFITHDKQIERGWKSYCFVRHRGEWSLLSWRMQPFSLPKLLALGTCIRDFKNYDFQTHYTV